MRVLFTGRTTPIVEALRREMEPAWVIDVDDGGPVFLAARKHHYEALVLQSADPDEAAALCTSIRDDLNWVPIILCCSGEDATEVAIRGLDAGADAFVVDPTPTELTALARAMARRKAEPRPAVLVVRDLELNPAARSVTRSGRQIALTGREFSLLEFLMRNAGIVLSRASILDAVWGFDYTGASNVVDVYVGYLRRKLDKPFGNTIIRSVRGIGYTMDAPVQFIEAPAITQIDLRDDRTDANEGHPDTLGA